jgi:hypothetical protein
MVFRKKKRKVVIPIWHWMLVSALQVFGIRICDIFCKVSTYKSKLFVQTLRGYIPQQLLLKWYLVPSNSPSVNKIRG